MDNQLQIAAPKKVWWKSSTIWAIVFSLLFGLLGKYGIETPTLPPNQDATELTEKGKAVTDAAKASDWKSIATSTLSFLFAALAIYNRSTATTALTNSAEKAEIHNEQLLTVLTTDTTAKEAGLVKKE
jgi:hypothetical protein